MLGAALRDRGYREGTVVRRPKTSEGGVTIEAITDEGIVIGRTIGSGQVLSLRAETVFAKYTITKQ